LDHLRFGQGVTNGPNDKAAQLGTNTPTGDSRLSQIFVPTGRHLSFRYRLNCQDDVATNWFTVSLTNLTTGQSWTVIKRVCTNIPDTQGTALLTIGQRYQIMFINRDDGLPGDSSWAVVNQVTISA
jgi:hypothetical protein